MIIFVYNAWIFRCVCIKIIYSDYGSGKIKLSFFKTPPSPPGRDWRSDTPIGPADAGAGVPFVNVSRLFLEAVCQYYSKVSTYGNVVSEHFWNELLWHICEINMTCLLKLQFELKFHPGKLNDMKILPVREATEENIIKILILITYAICFTCLIWI